MPPHNNENSNPRSDASNAPRPEDNPFIAFRRFADSHISSLFNSVLSLPSTLATFNNAHHAREQCLFGQADPEKCAELKNLEDQCRGIADEALKLLHHGDVDGVLEKGRELAEVDDLAAAIRREIVDKGRGDGRDYDTQTETQAQLLVRENNNRLVEKVGSQKGQEWAWSWSWGFPRPFDAEEGERLAGNEESQRHKRMCHSLRRGPHVEGHNEATDDGEEWATRRWTTRRHFADWRHRHQHPQQDTFAAVAGDPAEIVRATRLVEAQALSSNTDPNAYAVRTVEENPYLRQSGIHWRDAFDDLQRARIGEPLMSTEELGQASEMPYELWGSRLWHRVQNSADIGTYEHIFGALYAPMGNPTYPATDMERTAWGPWQPSVKEEEEPSYEYAHDHEDQHDDPPTPKPRQSTWNPGDPATELEAYERLLNPPQDMQSAKSETTSGTRPSVLSTLTTTERTVASDGTVTTKVVLRKRFADGREESSETVQTQRGQEEVQGQIRDPWKEMQDAQVPSSKTTDEAKQKKGWFWSN